jgi:hypothetical protein
MERRILSTILRGEIMRLICLSILGGIIGVLLSSLLGIDGSEVSSSFVFAMWMMGFFSPGLYCLNKVYNEIKKK